MNTGIKHITLTTILLAVLTLTACGTMEIGVETPVESDDVEGSVPAQEPSGDPTGEADMPANEPAHRMVQAWFGHVASAPETTAYDDQFILLPEGTGVVGLQGRTTEMDATLASLRDAAGPEEHVHIWGELVCDVDDVGTCRVVVDQLRYGTIQIAPESVEGWEGVITTSSFNGGLSYVFVRNEYGYSIWYSIHSTDAGILEQLEGLAGTDQLVRVSGELMTGIPDVNGSRIQAEQLEIVGLAEAIPGSIPEEVDMYSGWETYTSARYGYSFRYPVNGTLTETGVVGFDPDELPEGMTIEAYMRQLMEDYGEELCVQVESGLGYLAITPAENADFSYTPCGRTGTGAGEMLDLAREVEISGTTVQAEGYELQGSGETLDLHYETLVLTLINGLRIEFGSVSRTDATYTDYEMKGIQTLLMILASFEELG